MIHIISELTSHCQHSVTRRLIFIMIFHQTFIPFDTKHSSNPTTMESSEPSFQAVCQRVFLRFLLVSEGSWDSSHSLHRRQSPSTTCIPLFFRRAPGLLSQTSLPPFKLKFLRHLPFSLHSSNIYSVPWHRISVPHCSLWFLLHVSCP